MSIKQLTNRRLINRISRAAIAREIGVSRAWILRIEEGYDGPSFPEYKSQYEAALNKLIEEKRSPMAHEEAPDER